jgi:hypothetical protein
MGEIPKRASAVAASTVGDTINPLVTGLMAAAAIVVHRPELAWISVPAGAFAGALGEQGVDLVTQVLHDRASRVNRFTQVVEDEQGMPIDEFISENVDDDAKREFLGSVVSEVADARTDWKIKTLARAFVMGAKDGAVIDSTLMLTNLLRNLDPAHVRLMTAIKKTPFTNGFRLADDVLDQDPGLRPGFPFLRRDLARLDLLNPQAMSLSLNDLGEACATWLETLGSEAPPP